MNAKSFLFMGVMFLAAASGTMAQPVTEKKLWNFDKDNVGGIPAGFEAYSGRWAVRADAGAPSHPNVLAQEATNETWPGIVAKDSNYGDLQAEVKFKTISGREDQAAGIIFRYQD